MKKSFVLAILAVFLLSSSALAEKIRLKPDLEEMRFSNVKVSKSLVSDFKKDGYAMWVNGIPGKGIYNVTFVYARANQGEAKGWIQSTNALWPYNYHDGLKFPPTSKGKNDWSVFKSVTFSNLEMFAEGNLFVFPEDCGKTDRFINIREVIVEKIK